MSGHDGLGGAAGQRRRELAANLRAVRERLAAACAAASREPGEVTLVAVTKTRPATDVWHLAELGVRDFGENRDQEASTKAAAIAAMSTPVRWHFVGRLQRNKCRSVVRYADMVQSVDGVRLARALAEAAQRHREHPLDVLVQVSIDAAAGRGGAVLDAAGEPDADRDADSGADSVVDLHADLDTHPGADFDADLDSVLRCVEESGSLRLRGLMAVAPPAWEPGRAFARLAEIAARVRTAHPAVTLLSAGMSGDIEAAIMYGATHVRVGTALLGNRPVLM